MGEKYKEILELYDYCVKIGVEATLSRMFDGYVIKFNNGGDCIQHLGSYNHDDGCVEPAIGCRKDYTAVSLKNAKALVRRWKDRLNKGVNG